MNAAVPTKEAALRQAAKETLQYAWTTLEMTYEKPDRHRLPGILQDLVAAVEKLLACSAQVDPDIIYAIEIGKRSTFGLPRCAEALAQETIVQAARIGGGL